MMMNRSMPSQPLMMVAAAALLAGAVLIGMSRMPAPPLATPHPMAAHLATSTKPSGITARTVSDEALAHVPGKRVTVEIVDFPPGAAAPEHHHGGSVTVYVLAGTVRSQIAGGPLLDYRPGETFFEPPGAVHVVAMNPSLTEPAKFMAIHIADQGVALTTYH